MLHDLGKKCFEIESNRVAIHVVMHRPPSTGSSMTDRRLILWTDAAAKPAGPLWSTQENNRDATGHSSRYAHCYMSAIQVSALV